jgi:hypothetical protein
MDREDDIHRLAVFSNFAERPSPISPGSARIWAYTDKISYEPGDTVRVHASTTEPTFDACVLRDTASPETVLARRAIKGSLHGTPDDCSVRGCGWPVAFEFEIPADWRSATYRLTTSAGASAEHHHLFIVRPTSAAAGKAGGRLLLVASTATWTAYNDWGGSNHYEGITGPNGDQYSPVLSLDRPLARGLALLPPEAPRVALAERPPIGARPRYPHMEWAYRNGYSKKYASAGWASYDRHFAHWAEREGLAVDIISQTDLHFRPALIERYACLVFVGHDEYWSWEMRDAVDAYVDKGGCVARFAGNFMWQIRLEDEGRRQLCYKYRARAEDPIRSGDRAHLVTDSWEAPEVGRPGALTFGLNATRGLYVGWGACVPRGARGFPIYRPEHWAFAGTGLCYGDVLGSDSHVFGYEVDGLDYVVRGGLAYPSGAEAVPEGLEILALGLSTLAEEGEMARAGEMFIGLEDAAFAARTLEGRADAAAIDRVKRGAGMIVSFRRGKGEVFHAGSCEWVAGLIRRDAAVMRVTRNVLERFLGGRVGA